MTVSYGRGAKGRATRLHSQLIRARAGYRCERCDERDKAKLQCAHIIGRNYAWTRTLVAVPGLPDNGFCLCAACHRWFTEHPVDFGEFTVERLGEDAYQALLERSQERQKFDWEEEAERLSELARKIGL